MAQTDKPWTDEPRLRELYCRKKLSQREIAEKMGCSRKTIGNWLDRLGVEKRSLREAHAISSDGVQIRIDKDGYVVWRNVYGGDEYRQVVHGLLAVAMYGFDAVCGMDCHHKNEIPWDNRPENIELKGKGPHGRMHALDRWGDNPPWRDEETLHRLYVDENLGITEVAEELCCTTDTVYRWLDEYGIKKPWREEETVRKLREERGLSYREMANEFGCSKSNAAKWVKIHGVE